MQVVIIMIFPFLRVGAVVAQRSLKPQVAGSNPAPAAISLRSTAQSIPCAFLLPFGRAFGSGVFCFPFCAIRALN